MVYKGELFPAVHVCSELGVKQHAEIFALEHKYMQKENIASIESEMSWIAKCPLAISIILGADMAVVGHLAIYPITDECVKKLQSGMSDVDMVEDDLSGDLSECKSLYISIMCIDEAYRNELSKYLLYKEQYLNFEMYQKVGVYFNNVYAECTTVDGVNIALALGFVKCKKTGTNRLLMKTDFSVFLEKIETFLNDFEKMYAELVPDDYKIINQF